VDALSLGELIKVSYGSEDVVAILLVGSSEVVLSTSEEWSAFERSLASRSPAEDDAVSLGAGGSLQGLLRTLALPGV